MPYDHETACLAAGMLLGMLFYQRTGWACGGIITPGVIAMVAPDPARIGVALLGGLVTWLLLESLVRVSGVYGRQRLAAAMLIALALRYPLVSLWGETSLWLGWVVPGLIGADVQRQGLVPTLAGAISVSIAAALSVYLLHGLIA
ncbi:MAG: capsule biosynthesis protein CapC [Xanthomonadales bacterium]|nr:poly-gamma-glutamate biosynthesis protein PgsC/CapC [Gammaproteobacteria bacterium]MBT8050317.1 poly-gamma-glutamate biosynthesis protein PgsC/CapC [Gammaproteobacteria bacterium]MBT8056291.1 poly-gamma-glutamate biosynthesis protein PgsC/CapC [Gammaproteobacteria bacterium]NNJ79770.1 capsule biosynthesis protein CapC [Xanthomonadales bacterium]NNL04198.1 capsule biosynthesis protein CapC [Xanthomonadales bacterium]